MSAYRSVINNARRVAQSSRRALARICKIASFSVDEVVEIHDRLIDRFDRFGGTDGVRDPGLLECASTSARYGRDFLAAKIRLGVHGREIVGYE